MNNNNNIKRKEVKKINHLECESLLLTDQRKALVFMTVLRDQLSVHG